MDLGLSLSHFVLTVACLVFVQMNWEDSSPALLKPCGQDKKNVTDFADCSDCLTASLGYEEISNISVSLYDLTLYKGYNKASNISYKP